MLWIASFVYCWQSVGFKIDDHDLIKDYQLPAWGYSVFDIDFSGRSYYRRSDTNFKRVSEDYMINLSPDYLRTFESEKIKYLLNTDINTHIGYSGYENEEYEDNSIFRNYRFSPRINGNYDFYIKDNFFLNFSLDSRFSYYEVNVSQNYQDSIERQIHTSSFLGIGIGRIREVSPVFKALRLRERVEALNRGMTLTESQIKELADKFALYPQYANIYDRYEKYFWKEISPILGSDFDVLSLSENLYITEVMQEYIKRYQGNEILFGINFWQDYEIEHNGDKIKELYIGPSLSFNHYNNINLKYQIGIFSEISYLKYLTDDSTEDSKFTIDFTNSHLFDITDRIRWDSRINLDYNYFWYESIDGYTIRATLSSVIDYFIENNFSLYCQLKSELKHVDKDLYENNAYDYYYPNLKRDERVSLYFGCRYYFGSMF
jgi:hypothetical protein